MNREDNVVLITIDSLRLDHVGIYGYQKETTPNLDRFAKESVVFTEAIANGSHTAISFPAILTSSYASMYGGHGYISNERLSIAEWMSRQGYSTAAFHSNPYLSTKYNYDNYFDDFYDSMHSNFSSSTSFKILDKLVGLARENKYIRDLIPYILKIVSYYKPYSIPYEKAETLTQRAVRWLKRRENKSFLWIHYMDTHWPWIPQQPLERESVRPKDAFNLWWKMLIDSSSISDEELTKLVEFYDAEIRYLDYILGVFFNELKDMGLYDNSMIIVMSDHGEEFRDHGDIGHHYLKLYDELIHIPLMIKFPHAMYADTIVNDLVSFLDIAPTVADWFEKDIPQKWIGVSLLPILTKKETFKKRGVISEGNIKQGNNIISYRNKKWKYIINEGRKSRELYDIEIDPKETKNLSEKMLHTTQKLEIKIEKHISKTTGSPILLPKITDDEIILKRLKALGYI